MLSPAESSFISNHHQRTEQWFPLETSLFQTERSFTIGQQQQMVWSLTPRDNDLPSGKGAAGAVNGEPAGRG